MCRGSHKYCVTVKASGAYGMRPMSFDHRSYLAAAKHTKRLNGKKQPRLSRWYNAGKSAKVIIRRECPATRVARSTKGSNRRSVR